MDTSVPIDTQMLKASLKRNIVGKVLISVVFLTVVFFATMYSFLTPFLAFITIGVFIIASQCADYFLGISLLIDQAIFAIRKRGQNAS